MTKFNPQKLEVEYRDGVSATEPIIPRKHTLTHSDLTAQLFLTIATQFAWDKVNTDMRDEVMGEWRMNDNSLFYSVYLFLDKDDLDFNGIVKRNEIFRRELPLALTAIRYGDRFIFERYPFLDHVFIIVNFISVFPQLLKQENWGTFNSFTL